MNRTSSSWIQSAKERMSISFGKIGLGSERDYLLQNLGTLITSGMTVLEALETVEEGSRSRALSRLIGRIRAEIESGSPLWKALAAPDLFSAAAISLIRSGEESGKLSQNMRLVSEQEEKSRLFRSRIRSAMLYPVFVFSLTIILGIGIAWFILPKLAAVFSQLKIELPLITKILISAGNFLALHGAVAIPIFVAVVAVIVFFIFFFSKTKFIGQAMLLRTPGIGTLIQEVELARFSYLLGTLLSAGLPIQRALHTLTQATAIPAYERLYLYLEQSIIEGNSFEQAFKGYRRLDRLIPVTIQRLVTTGERSGSLSKTLVSVSTTYEAKVETTTKNISIILEPVLLVIVWLGVVAVALAVILPIYSLVGGLKT